MIVPYIVLAEKWLDKQRPDYYPNGEVPNIYQRPNFPSDRGGTYVSCSSGCKCWGPSQSNPIYVDCVGADADVIPQVPSDF